MEEYKEQYSRDEVVKRPEEYPIEDLHTMSMLVDFLDQEVTQMGFTGLEAKIYCDLKRAELLFDAGLEPDAIRELKAVREEALKAGLGNFVNENAVDFQKNVESMLG